MSDPTMAELLIRNRAGDLDAIPATPEDIATWLARAAAFLAGGGPWGTGQPGQRAALLPTERATPREFPNNDRPWTVRRTTPSSSPGALDYLFRKVDLPGVIPIDQALAIASAPLSDIVRSGDRDAMRAASEASFDVASMLPAAGVAAGRTIPDGAAGIFGGRLAKTADQAALKRAEDMAAKGAPREDIWNQTGWFKGVDGQWRFEIDDSMADYLGAGRRFDQVMDHADLVSAYPDLGSAPVRSLTPAEQMRGVAAAYNPLSEEFAMRRAQPYDDRAKSAGLHEAQHYIQGEEGFAQGASESLARGYLNDQMATENAPRSRGEVIDAYKKAAGEVEARTVQRRMDLTPAERRARPPWLDYDVPESQQIMFSNPDDTSTAAILAAINQSTLSNFERASTHPRDRGADGRNVFGSPKATHTPSMDNEAFGWWREVGNDVIDARTGESVYDWDTANNFNAIQGGKAPRAAIEGFNEHDAYTLNKDMMDFMEAEAPRRAFLNSNPDDPTTAAILAAMNAQERPQGSATFYTFGGEKARTADKVALATATQMEKQGIPREQIWNDTGWFKGVDGKWRFEIDDSQAEVLGGVKTARRFDKAIDHPDLAAAYPGLGAAPVRGVKPSEEMMGMVAAYNPLTKEFALRNAPEFDAKTKSSGLHEAQHYIQGEEGFAQGSSEALARGDLNNRAAAAQIAAHEAAIADKPTGLQYFSQKAWQDYYSRLADTMTDRLRARREAADAPRSRREILDAYKQSAGEVESRTVQKRMNMTADERRARPPWLDYDVPENQQIVRLASNPDDLNTSAVLAALQAGNVDEALAATNARTSTTQPPSLRGAGDQDPGAQARALQWQMPRGRPADVDPPAAPANANQSGAPAQMLGDLDAIEAMLGEKLPPQRHNPAPDTPGATPLHSWKTARDAIDASRPVLRDLASRYGASLMSSEGLAARSGGLAYPPPAELHRMLNMVADGIRRADPPRSPYGFGYQITDSPTGVRWTSGADGDTLVVGTKATAADVEQAVKGKLYSNPDDPTTAAILAAMGAQDKPQGIKAYHGSRQDFDAFETPAFFSTKEGIANRYRMHGGGGDNINGKYNEPPPGYILAVDHYLDNGKDKDAARNALHASRMQARKNGLVPDEEFQAALDYLQSGKTLGTSYEVRLPEPDYTYPFLESPDQKQAIADAMAKGHKVIGLYGGDELVALDPSVINIVRKYSNAPDPNTAAILAILAAQQQGGQHQ